MFLWESKTMTDCEVMIAQLLMINYANNTNLHQKEYF
jgi:hypothetical protein